MTIRKGPRGLASIANAQGERFSGGARWTTQAGVIAALSVVASLILYEVVSAHDLNSKRQALLAKQRAVVATLGTEWTPLRDDLEGDVLRAAKPYGGDEITSEARSGAFRTQPGIYLRMRVADASTAEAIRQVAADAKRDAFAGCLLREPNERGVRGEKGGAFAEQPWNLGQAYAATRILTPAWVSAVGDADDDLRIRIFVEQYDKAVRDEIPVAIDIVKQAKFFLLVLDEDVSGGAPPDGGPATEESLQLVAHPSRISLFDLQSHREILRLRRSGGGAQIIQAGERAVTDDETRAAMQRQANNCSLAWQVEAALALPGAPND